MDRCRYAVEYKAKRIPGCDCELCWKKWHIREIADKLTINIDLGGLSLDDVGVIFTALQSTLKRAIDERKAKTN